MDGFDSDDVSAAGLERIDAELEQFRRYAADGRQVGLRCYWVSRSPHAPLLDEMERLVCLTALVKADMGRRFEQGESPAVTEYLKEFPELRAASNRVVSLVYEEFCLREERGEPLDVDSFCDRYAPWKDSLKAQLGYHRILSQAAGLAPPQPSFPKVGEWFEEFELLGRIGRGGYSRVYLAADHSLGGKRVVLKVAVDRGREAEAQGALDHPHIVSVNSVAYQDDGDFRGLSMPYRPGLPLDDVAYRLRLDGRRPRSAAELWNAMASGIRDSDTPVDRELDEALEIGPTSDGWRGFPVNGSFARGVAWVGMVLARALAYAHDHRTFHRDVKPGNVLLTVQHGPQLLDFNLAQSPHSANEAQSAFQGGTLPYMAPEQIEAFLNPARWADVAGPADVYSLGLVLRELLTGEPLDVPDRKLLTPRALQNLLDRRICLASDVRRYAPSTPHALEAIVRKCLQYEPEKRYSSARQLVEDLERFLQHRPLIHAVNPSRKERAGEWAVRNRRLLVANAFYLSLLALISPLLVQRASLLLLPDLKDRPDWRRAAEAVESGSYLKAEPILANLMKLYPESPLLRFYQSFARNEAGSSIPSPAQFDYAAAMNFPRAHDELREWAANHKDDVVRLLNSFGTRRLDHYSVETQWKRDMSPEERAPLIEELNTAADAFNLVLELSPESAIALQGLATIDEIHGDPEKAYDRLTTALEIIARAPDRGPDRLPFSLRTQRGRVSTFLAKLSMRGNDQARAHALEMLNEAIADLDDQGLSTIDENQLLRPACRTEALLTRGFLHHLLGNLAQGRDDCRNAKEAMDLWIKNARTVGSPVKDENEKEFRQRYLDLHDRVASAANDSVSE